jgi:hypothetical protein
MTLIELRKLAEAATAGPWVFVNHNNEAHESQPTDDWSVKTGDGLVICSEPQCSFEKLPSVCSGAYIAAANPAAVISLLDQIQALQAERDHAMQDSQHWCDKYAALRAERDALAAKLATPDMFWNADDAEQMHHSIDEFLNDEICNGVCKVGGKFEIQRAVRLPNIKIKVTAIDDESCEAEYEVIDAAKGGQHEDA